MKPELLTFHRSPLEASFYSFLLDREASRCTSKTLIHYRYTVGSFVDWLASHKVSCVADITPHHIRAYLVSLQKRGLKDTTQHAHARGIKAWLHWLVREGDLDVSPMSRVAMPKLKKRVLPPFSREEVHRLLATCDRHTAIGSRNYAMVLALQDTGLRAQEFVSLTVGNLDMRSGLTTVIGKGQKQRTVRVGSKARSSILRMLGFRGEMPNEAPVWVSYDSRGREQGGLKLHGLQTALVRLGRKSGVQPCGPHRFRRTFALWCLRDGMDLHSLRLLMGQSTLAVLQRYLALAGEDVERAHVAHSPVDKML